MSLSLPHPESVSSPIVVDTFGTIQIVSSRADVKSNLFLNPPSTGSNGPDNSVWVLGTTQHVKWTTTIANFDFLLYQQLVCDDNNCVNGPFLIAKNLTNETNSWDWQVTTGTLTLKPTNTFFLIIRDVNDDQNQFGSSYLNFTSSSPVSGGGGSSKQTSTSSTKSQFVTESSSTTLSPIGSTTTIRTSSSPANTLTTSSLPSFLSTSTIPSPTSTATSSTVATALPISSSSSGISTGAKVGMIVGAISAVVIAIFLGWYLGRRRKSRSTKSPFHPFETPDPAPPVQLSELHVPGWGEQKPIPPPFTPRELHGKGKFDSFTGVRELDAWDKPFELGDGRRSGYKSGVYELGPKYT